MPWLKNLFNKLRAKYNEPEDKNLENILEIECPLCKTKYRIGIDSIITTPEEVLASFGANILSSENAISEFSNQPDIIDRIKSIKTKNKNNLIVNSQNTVLKIRNNINSGQKRYWKCNKCNNTGNPTLYTL